MKLKNKKTGEIIEAESLSVDTPTEGIVGVPSFDRKGSYNSLAELNEEWEDYEETKYYYAITSITANAGITKMKNKHNDMTAFDKAIGNYFGTKEEAEKAVEKLKAWKRLKDKGFRFSEWEEGTKDYKVIITGIIPKGLLDDEQDNENLDLLFGGGK